MKDVIIKNFTCGYEQKTVFENFGVTFGQGKINVVLGGSGVGKTTLLNALAGLKTYEGSIEGCEDGVSYIFQKDRLIPSISVYKNLDLVLKGIVKDKNERKSRIEKNGKRSRNFRRAEKTSERDKRRSGAKGKYGKSIAVSLWRSAFGRAVQGA